MSEILSQEQIDALLNSGMGGSGSESSEVDYLPDSPSSSSDEAKAKGLSKLLGMFCDQSSTIISTVLNKGTNFTADVNEPADFNKVASQLQGPLLLLTLNFKSGFDGSFYLLIQKKDVAILSDLMMMGDGNAEYSEDHKDAISELFNQVMGAYSTALGQELGGSFSADQVTVNEFEVDNPPFPPDAVEMVITKLVVVDVTESNVIFLLPSDFVEQVIQKMPAEKSGGASIPDSIGLNMSELDDLSRVSSSDYSMSGSTGFQETNLAGESLHNAPRENINMLLDIDLDVSIELGRSILSIKRVLELAPGAIVELDRMAGEPVDLLVNNKVVAKGEVVVIDENFGIRIVSLVSPEERIKSLR